MPLRSPEKIRADEEVEARRAGLSLRNELMTLLGQPLAKAAQAAVSSAMEDSGRGTLRELVWDAQAVRRDPAWRRALVEAIATWATTVHRALRDALADGYSYDLTARGELLGLVVEATDDDRQQAGGLPIHGPTADEAAAGLALRLRDALHRALMATVRGGPAATLASLPERMRSEADGVASAAGNLATEAWFVGAGLALQEVTAFAASQAGA